MGGEEWSVKDRKMKKIRKIFLEGHMTEDMDGGEWP